MEKSQAVDSDFNSSSLEDSYKIHEPLETWEPPNINFGRDETAESGDDSSVNLSLDFGISDE